MPLQTTQVKPAAIDPKLTHVVLVKKELLRLYAVIGRSLNFLNLNSFLLIVPRTIFLNVVLDNVNAWDKLDA